MRYLFVDVQYNSAYKNEIIEIATATTEDDGNIKNTFSRLVKSKYLDKISNAQMRRMQITNKILKHASDIYAVMDTFCKTNKKIDILVMWDRTEYNIFMSKMIEHNIAIPRYTFIALKEIIEICDKCYYKSMTMKNASFIYDVCKMTDERSKSNVQTLVSIFNTLRKQYSNRFVRGEISSFRRVKCSNIIHASDCHYIKDRSQIEMVTLSEIFSGKRMCKICMKKNKFPQLPMRNIPHKNFNESISKLCTQHKMTASFDDENNLIMINSGIAYWKIRHVRGDIINVYHENYHLSRSTHFKGVEVRWDVGFHNQNIKPDNFGGAIQYIYKHDKNFERKYRIISTYHFCAT